MKGGKSGHHRRWGIVFGRISSALKKPKKETTEAPAKSRYVNMCSSCRFLTYLSQAVPGLLFLLLLFSYTFHERDPNKKKGKKKAHHAFTSKSKFKHMG
jgi:hypothetical protein